MWICFNDSFLSIVENREDDSTLLVRARIAGDIDRVFPGARTWQDLGADYHFRANIPRAQVATAIAERLQAIDYPNFKGSVTDPDRKDAYLEVWGVLTQLQR